MAKIKKWTPYKGVSNSVCIESLIDDYNGLKVSMADESNEKITIELLFQNFYGYRNFNESERIKTLNEFPEIAVKWSFFIAIDSKFINWLINESERIVEKEKVVHYIITTADDIVEVLASEPPKVIIEN